MALDIHDIKLRCAALEIEALAAISQTADAVPYYFHTQESYPYFTNRLGAVAIDSGTGGDDSFGEEFDTYTYDIIVRLVVEHLTAGTPGEYDDRLDVYLPQVVAWFHGRELLQSAAYPTAPAHLIRARFIGATGLAFFSDGLNVTQIGAELTLRCEFTEGITQAYL